MLRRVRRTTKVVRGGNSGSALSWLLGLLQVSFVTSALGYRLLGRQYENMSSKDENFWDILYLVGEFLLAAGRNKAGSESQRTLADCSRTKRSAIAAHS